MSVHESWLRRQVESVSAKAWEKLDKLDVLKPEEGSRILQFVLEFACDAQNAGAIRAGRTAFQRIPKKWLAMHLQDAVEHTLDLNDEWHYRRLLELLENTMPNMFNMY